MNRGGSAGPFRSGGVPPPTAAAGGGAAPPSDAGRVDTLRHRCLHVGVPAGVDFLGIGSEHAGTTWLYRELKSHPRTRFPVGKEFHFWDTKRVRGMTVAEYLGRFPDPGPGFRQGEITPTYAVLAPEVIGELAEALPSVKLFCTLRNPIARAWSQMETVRNFAFLEPFEVSDQFYLDHVWSEEVYRRGNFVEWLPHWRADFPANRLLTIDYDEIVDRPRRVLLRLARHLGLDPQHFRARSSARLRQRVNKRRMDTVRARPTPVVLEALRERYRPLLPAMSAALGRDVSAWLAWDGS